MKRQAFTVIELLVVVGILALLAGIIAAVTLKAQASAEDARIRADLATISIAISAYKQDFGGIPRLDPSVMAPGADPLMNELGNPGYLYGSELLCWSIIAPYDATASGPWSPGDGAPGPGWRQRGTQGQVVGAYLDIGKMRFGVHPQAPRYQVILDYNDVPILYMAARSQMTATDSTGKQVAVARSPEFGYLKRSTASLYDFRYVDPAFSLDGNDSAVRLTRAQAAAGDTNGNGYIDGSEEGMQAEFVL
jgi:prepilin-type N-terminal cleavage/methylation domain-containing protein